MEGMDEHLPNPNSIEFEKEKITKKE